MPLQLVSPPTLEPVTLDEAKAHLKVDTTDDDALIGTLISAARARAEWHTGRAFLTQSWTCLLDAWPCAGWIEIPLPPLQAVSTITTYAANDAATVLDSSLYQVDAASNPARIALKPGVTLPVNLRALNAIEIAFTAGYGDAESNVPAQIRAAILELVANAYANRGDTSGDLPLEALALLAPYRIVKLYRKT
jgi:uncharacterized phiE125 gp8 family phage protein